MRYEVVLEADALTGEKELDSGNRGFWMGEDGTFCIPGKTLRAAFRSGGAQLRWPKRRYSEAWVEEHEVSLGCSEPHRIVDVGYRDSLVEVVENVRLCFHIEADLSLDDMEAAWAAAGRFGFGAARLPFTATVAEA